MANASLSSWIQSEMADLRARDLFRYPRVHESMRGGRVKVNGRLEAELSSNEVSSSE